MLYVIWFHFSIDATDEPTSGPCYGRLVNHGRKNDRNSVMKVLAVDGAPTLCLFASKVIPAGAEILYDYGVKVPWESSGFEVRELKQSPL